MLRSKRCLRRKIIRLPWFGPTFLLPISSLSKVSIHKLCCVWIILCICRVNVVPIFLKRRDCFLRFRVESCFGSRVLKLCQSQSESDLGQGECHSADMVRCSRAYHGGDYQSGRYHWRRVKRKDPPRPVKKLGADGRICWAFA